MTDLETPHNVRRNVISMPKQEIVSSIFVYRLIVSLWHRKQRMSQMQLRLMCSARAFMINVLSRTCSLLTRRCGQTVGTALRKICTVMFASARTCRPTCSNDSLRSLLSHLAVILVSLEEWGCSGLRTLSFLAPP